MCECVRQLLTPYFRLCAMIKDEKYEMKDEVGMAVQQTRVAGIITILVHPYVCHSLKYYMQLLITAVICLIRNKHVPVLCWLSLLLLFLALPSLFHLLFQDKLTTEMLT